LGIYLPSKSFFDIDFLSKNFLLRKKLLTRQGLVRNFSLRWIYA